MNCLTGHPRVTKKGVEHANRNCWDNYSVQPHNERALQAAHGWLRSTNSRSFVFCQHNISRDFASAKNASRLRLRPAISRWSHCSLCQVLSVAVNLTSAKMTLMEPYRRMSHWDCDSGRTIKRQQSGHLWPRGSPPGPHSGMTPEVGHGMLVWLNAASSGEFWRSSRSPDGVFTVNGRVETSARMTAPSFMPRSRVSDRRAMHPDLRLAHWLLMWMLAVVKWSRSTNGRVPCEIFQWPPCLQQPMLVTQRTWNLKWCTGDVVLVRIRVEEHGTVVLDDHVEVLTQGTVGDEARQLLFANHMPWAVEVRCKQTPIRTTCWSCVPRQDLQLVNGSHVGLVGLQRQARETGGTNGPELGSGLAVVEKGDAPARLAGLLDAPSIHPITVILAIRRERIVSTKSQGAVNLTEAEQRPINVRGRERRNAGRKLNVRRSRDPLIRAAAEAANIKTPTA